MLTITLSTELVALVACSRYSAAYGNTRTYCPSTRTVRMLSMLAWGAVSDQVRALDTSMLFEMLERVVGPRGKTIECSTMHMAWRDKATRQHR